MPVRRKAFILYRVGNEHYIVSCERMEHPEQIASSDLDLKRKKLGEISINKDAFDLDLKINEGYQNYSGELLRLALLILTGLAVVWIKLYLPEDNHPKAPPF